ncbi:TonB-dependent receptor [Pontibacter sp. G13]|uniref:TonB-dependent receptor n=1 Tax=Pontibacter sp. G13 TaxID=3074898 RepID=UPI00288C2FD2|nr:TonB-dependent receptor [Pontibacter sp. G13]WNJ17876.1 TonB-dependent receptor [Pontibacter sp. G13]
MNRIYILFSLVACMVLGTAANAQTGSIEGSIQTADQQPAAFAKVKLVNSAFGAATDETGHFKFDRVQPGTYALVVSYLGSEQSQEVTVSARNTSQVNITLTQTERQLQEVVISTNVNTYNPFQSSKSLRVVTPLMELPQNVQIVNQSVLQDQQVLNMLEGVQRNVSGAQKLEHWDNYARINIRGTQATPFRNGMNVQLSSWSPLTEDMAMVEQIEFVKGPAGFMLANGQPGGMYNVVTKKPSGVNRGSAALTVGSFDTYRAEVDLDGVLTQNGKLRYRLNVAGQLAGSHRDFEYNNRYVFAPVLQYLIDDNTKLTVEYTDQQVETSMIGGNYAFSARGYGDLPVNFTTSEANLDPTTMREQNVLVQFEHHLNDNWTVHAQAGYLHYEQEGQSLWPWGIAAENDSMMQRGISIWDALGFSQNGQAWVNGQIETGPITHRIMGGIDGNFRDYFADWNQGAALGGAFNIYNPVYGTIPTSEVPQWDREQDIRERGVRYTQGSTGLYVQDELGFLDNKLRVTLAGRYTQNHYLNPYSGNATDDKFTPRVGLSFSYAEDAAVYALYDQVFLANTGLDWAGNNFDPVTGTNIELGVKQQFFDGAWMASLSAYQIIKQNVLTADLEHADPTTGQFVFSRTNGEQRVQGIELDVRGEIFENFELIFNYAYTDAQVTEDAFPELVGTDVPGASKHIQNTWVNYQIASGALKGLRASVGYTFLGDRSTWAAFDDTEAGLPDYFRLDGAIGYQHGKFSVGLNVNNLLDEFLYSGAPSWGMYYWQTEPGRNYRLRIGYTF